MQKNTWNFAQQQWVAIFVVLELFWAICVILFLLLLLLQPLTDVALCKDCNWVNDFELFSEWV